ncbi:MAG: pre-peptidase C-terminal domain-containing protein, partial [Sedimentisphaerales bacterium]|nr:pre-peptidase C-terminal domain-containing protein [Sedimentisphaerales bacterium]
ATADGIAPSVNIVALTDGSAQYDYSDMKFDVNGVETSFDLDWYESTIYWSMAPYLTAEDVGEKNCGDPDTITDFVDWAVANYVADNYALVLMDHGGQYYGTCWDEGSDDDRITMSEVTDIAEHFSNNGIDLDLAIMESCVMAGIEPAYQFANLADYYVACEPTSWTDIVDGHEFSVRLSIAELLDDSNMTPEQFGRVVLDNYTDISDYVVLGQALSDYEYTISAVSLTDTSLIDEIVIAVDSFGDYMLTEASGNDWQAVDAARRAALQFEEIFFYDRFCDLGDFMVKVQQYSDNAQLDILAGNVADAIDNAVIDIRYDRHAKQATGLTVSMPLPESLGDIDDLVLEDYNNSLRFLQDTSWDRFLYDYVTRNISSQADDYADVIAGSVSLTVPEQIDGTLEKQTDKDYFSFSAIAGTAYSLRCDSKGGGMNSTQEPLDELQDVFGVTDTVITIYDAEGNILASDDDSGLDENAALTWTAPDDGIYYVSVSSYAGGMTPFVTGDYTLTVKEHTAAWTVMLYMAVDNNLDDSINEEIFSLIDAYQESLGSDNWSEINIVAFTDGLDSGENTFANSVYWQIAPALAGEDMGELDSGSPETFVDFVEWAQVNYPAEKYLMIDNNHGGNIFGMDWDDSSESNISPRDFSYIAQQFRERGIHIDVFDFSMCVMAGLEIAWQAQGITDYYVASEPITMTNGFIGACDNIYGQVAALMADPATTPDEISRIIVDLYRENMPDAIAEADYYPDSLCMVEMALLDDLVDAVDSFSSYMLDQATEADWQVLAEARSMVTTFDPGDDWFYNSIVDLGHLMTLVSESADNAPLRSLADDVLAAHALAVPYNATDKNAKEAMGLTIYLPEQDGRISTAYADFMTGFNAVTELDFSFDTSWDELAFYFCKYSSAFAASTAIDIPSGGVTFYDADGTKVNVRLSNAEGIISFAGNIERVENRGSRIVVTGDDLMMNSIIMEQGTVKTALNISTSGGTVRGTELGGISDDVFGSEGVSIKSISASGVVLTGDLDIDGWLGSVKLAAVADGVAICSAGATESLPNKAISNFRIDDIGQGVVFDVFGKLNTLTARRCQADIIAADDIGTIKISNSGLSANVYSYAGDISKVYANGDISGRIYAADEIGRILNRSGAFTGSARSGLGLAQFNFTDLEEQIVG